MNDPICSGSLSILPLLRLFAELSQIDDLAHLGLSGIFTAQTAHLT